ncbi:hypothetical protein ACFOYW_12410 [Gryllotalpicola reticulitermitis]|uniref:Mannosyltransferase (PIG-V) n=1 Tax=Gryllotalpicola reticulitermitis TaxID=1184153 RepID=A0ABV8QA26_9MICO
MYVPTEALWAPQSEPESRIELSRRPLGRQLLAVTGLYAASRIFSTALIMLATWFVVTHGWHIPWLTTTPSFWISDGSWTPKVPSLADISALWDGARYQSIATVGYPVQLPRTSDGAIIPNTWAFLPLYPYLVAALQLVFGTGFASTGVVVASVFGAAATLMLYIVVRDRVGYRPAWFTATLFAFGPLAFLLQMAYAESLFLFLMFSALYLMQRRKYWWMLAPAVLAAFTRPGEVALALAIAVVFVVRWRAARRDADPFPIRQRVAMASGIVVTGLAGFAWPLVAWVVTGLPNAYTATELSWRDGFLGHTNFRIFTAWFELAGRYLGVGGVLIVVLVVVLFALWVGRRGIRPLGIEIVATTASYALYLLAVFMPQQSIFRVAMPLAPLMGDPRIVERAWLRRVILFVAVAAQPVCIAVLWFYANP